MIRKPVNYNSRTNSPEKPPIIPKTSTNSIHSSPLEQKKHITSTLTSTTSTNSNSTTKNLEFRNQIKVECNDAFLSTILSVQPVIKSSESIDLSNQFPSQKQSSVIKELSKHASSHATSRVPKNLDTIRPLEKPRKKHENENNFKTVDQTEPSVRIEKIDQEADPFGSGVQSEIALLESALIAKIKEIQETNDNAFNKMMDVANDILSKFQPEAINQHNLSNKSKGVGIGNEGEIDVSSTISTQLSSLNWPLKIENNPLEAKDSAIDLKGCVMDEVSDIKDLIISSKQVLKAEQAEIKGVKEKEEEKEKAFIMTIPFDKKPVIQQDYFIHSSTIDDTRLIDPEYSQIQNKTVSNRDPSAKLTTLDLPKLDFSLPLEIDRTETKELTKPSHLDFDLSSFTEEISNIFAFL